MRRMSIYEIKPIQFLTPRGGKSPIGLSKLSRMSTALENRLIEPLTFPMREVLQYHSLWEKRGAVLQLRIWSCTFLAPFSSQDVQRPHKLANIFHGVKGKMKSFMGHPLPPKEQTGI